MQRYRLRVGDAQPIPESDAELARCFDSLALLYADVLHELAQLRGEDFSQLHIVSSRLPEHAAQPAMCRCLRYSGDRRAC